MLATIRQTIPATRSMSDGRLLALVMALALLAMAATDLDGSTVAIGVAIAAAVFMQKQRCIRRSAVPPADEVSHVTTESSAHEDPLIARARALRERSAARG